MSFQRHTLTSGAVAADARCSSRRRHGRLRKAGATPYNSGAMIQINLISKAFGPQVVFAQATAFLQAQTRVGLVGPEWLGENHPVAPDQC